VSNELEAVQKDVDALLRVASALLDRMEVIEDELGISKRRRIGIRPVVKRNNGGGIVTTADE
jgi:hypothetical protein